MATNLICTATSLPDRLYLDFVLTLETTYPDYKSFKVTKKSHTNYVSFINIQIIETNEETFRYLEKEATESNKDFLTDKGLFLYTIAKIAPQDKDGFVSLTNEYFCTILSAIACVRIKSNKGSHGNAESAKQNRNTDIIWQFNERIDKVFDCLSKYFLIRHDKVNQIWTLENPIIGDCVVDFKQEKFSQMLAKLSPQTKPLVRGNKASDPAPKKTKKIKAESVQYIDEPKEDITVPQYNNMDVEYSHDYGYSCQGQHAIEASNPQAMVQTTPYPSPNPPYQQFMIDRSNQTYNNAPVTQIERDTGVPEHVWKAIEAKARTDPMILLKMINTLIPMRDRVIAMQRQGLDPRTLFVRSDQSNSNASDLNKRNK